MRTPPPTFDAELVAAIEDHLELDYWTEPIYSDTRNKGTYWEVKTVLYRGRENKSYPRPMFDTIDVDTFSGQSAAHVTVRGCSCYDFARTNRCESHPELPWNDKKRGWDRPDLPYTEDQRSDWEIERDERATAFADSLNGILRSTLPPTTLRPLYSGPRGDYTVTPAANVTTPAANTIEVRSEAGRFFSIETEGPSDLFNQAS